MGGHRVFGFGQPSGPIAEPVNRIFEEYLARLWSTCSFASDSDQWVSRKADTLVPKPRLWRPSVSFRVCGSTPIVYQGSPQ
ncbi:uncharacterized protein ACLA_007730 [Aspergillus clavatus NRRL 1]|uniref:Uncharacterized protein n=1 Tax=Aspergillus clavatus (strain ATCC 1007 / CBS 513.65 / DSM 816 / NCTC 3887 / NRRL 1 / QM 1276 / 107) TaxID=344612 RepID=A1CDT7_ASPCL|nr:uncharacterized protein ACLA_007730 [Aspergillus clavatus NRRL 1]EAW12014.1 hypothetical protein ACLA_007730 [Aspergillus clavatus NRRL 1]